MGMSDCIDLVIVETIIGGDILVCAPGFSGLKEGDSVLFGSGGNGGVISVLTVGVKSEVYEFAVKAAGAHDPLPRITSKVVYEDFDYDEQEEVTNG